MEENDTIEVMIEQVLRQISYTSTNFYRLVGVLCAIVKKQLGNSVILLSCIQFE